ncbi:hypothetical protein [Halorubrum ezzemoulense]|uniref:Uncharacterized protein n=1 Tax=Halorubrum ezzemoulense TaxID=337243 RepID=A0A256JKV6_HALEZ|nr:hypothetical protein [Halorubrum ezzemoulense]OYR69022.1 hypothetical protein DJ78_12230 [Halorubrum ezzemoulense]
MEPTAQTLARTYSDRVYTDPWEKVVDYRRVLDYAARNPNAGRTRVGNALDLLPSRVRGWLNSSVPDPARAVNTAAEQGWLDPDPSGEIAKALITLLAHVIAGGSISTETFVPAVATGRRVDVDEIRGAFTQLNVETTIRNAEVDGRATEVVPSKDASVLGRCLVAMGAPHGGKTRLDRLPPVVRDVPPAVRRSFVQTYLKHRALEQPNKATLQIKENRPEAYFEELQQLIRESANNGNVTRNGNMITISAEAARDLGVA